MGRTKDPVELRLLKNDKAHAHRYKDDQPPVPSTSKAQPPEDLSEAAKYYFNQFVERVEEMYPCSETDTYSIVLYANNHEQLVYLENLLRVEGLTYSCTTRAGEEMIKPRPEVVIHRDCKAFEMKILSEFGLTPSARAKVNLPKKTDDKKDNPFAKLAGKG